jgi:hypothetical protein
VKKSLMLKGAAALAAFALVGAACSSPAGSGSASGSGTDVGSHSTPVADAMSTGTDTQAAQLVQGLTDLLDSHVYLAGIAVEQAALTKDPSSPQFTAAAEALDANTKDLGAAIGSVYGNAAEKQFLQLWRKHIGFFVDYTIGGLTGDKQAQATARAALDHYRQDFGAFIDSATNGELPKDEVASALQMHVNSLITAIDEIVSGTGNPFMSLYEAAHHHMPDTASALAGGIVASNPDKF